MQTSDFNWFKENIASLYSKYGSAFLAIKNMRVLGAYATYADGVNETQKTEEIGTFIIQKCGSDESAYTNYISSFNFCA